MRRSASVVVIVVALLSGVIAGAPASARPVDAGSGAAPGLEPSGHSVVYRSETVIAAEPVRIWQLLIDLSDYETWNPWVVRAQGRAEPGAEVQVTVVMGAHRMPAKHIVLAVEPEQRFCWKDAGWNSWFVYGQRCRTLTRQSDGTVLVRNELRLEGALADAADLAMGPAMRDGMAAENAALKQHAERHR